MRKDNKYNRLTWHRKTKIGNHHPKYLNDIRREMKEYMDEDDRLYCCTEAGKQIVRTEIRQKEAIAIMDAITFLKYGDFSAKKPYLEQAYGKGTSYNGFTFQKVLWNWLVWKPTDVGGKWEPLVKVIPDTVSIENIPAVLDLQPWTYI